MVFLCEMPRLVEPGKISILRQIGAFAEAAQGYFRASVNGSMSKVDTVKLHSLRQSKLVD